jgi:hypothetical protein
VLLLIAAALAVVLLAAALAGLAGAGAIRGAGGLSFRRIHCLVSLLLALSALSQGLTGNLQKPYSALPPKRSGTF